MPEIRNPAGHTYLGSIVTDDELDEQAAALAAHEADTGLHGGGGSHADADHTTLATTADLDAETFTRVAADQAHVAAANPHTVYALTSHTHDSIDGGTATSTFDGAIDGGGA